MSRKLKFDYWPLERFNEYENNPRQNDHVVDRMEGSLDEFDAVVPILARSTGEVIDGHLRLKAARKKGMTEFPVIIADHMSDEQVRAFRILVNKSVNWADWDEERLRLEFEALEAAGFDLELTGYGLEEIEELLAATETISEGLTDDDAVPEVDEATIITKPGDLWILGDHRLYCGDSTSPESLATLMDGQLADMAFTDPPYNVNYGHTQKDKLRGKGRKILNDNLGEDFGLFLQKACENLLSVTKGAVYVCMSSSEIDTLKQAFVQAGGKWSTFVIWAKNHFTMGRSDYQRQYEPILYGWKDGNDRFWCGDRDQGDVWFIKRPVKNDLHPTMKPVELVERAIRNSSKTKDIILDPFGGSGTTLIACEKASRQCRMVELDPKYCDVIIRRWEEWTGSKAVHKERGDEFSNKN